MDDIRIYAATSPGDDLESMAVLEWSLHKHASRPVHITWMRQDGDEVFQGWNTRRWATPFTAFRWAVPELAGFTGKAIYCDSDVIFMRDPAELFDQDVPNGKCVLGKNASRICVSLWDCEKAQPHMVPIAELKRDADAHQRMSGIIRPLIASFEGNWNCMDSDGVPIDGAGALHYTRMKTQPQLVRHAYPRLEAQGRKHWIQGAREHPKWQALFDDLLTEATENGYGIDRYA